MGRESNTSLRQQPFLRYEILSLNSLVILNLKLLRPELLTVVRSNVRGLGLYSVVYVCNHESEVATSEIQLSLINASCNYVENVGIAHNDLND